MFKFIKLGLAVIALVALVIYGFYANEARKEVYFLCGNFAPGVKNADVIRQLDTITLSEYVIDDTHERRKITLSSLLTLHLLSCNVEISPDGIVTQTSYP